MSHAVRHNLREYTPEWVDPDRTHLNQDLVKSGATRAGIEQKMEERLSVVKRKIQHNAVKGVEVFASYSGGALPDDKGVDYLKDVHQWFSEKYGEENILSSTIHLDEEVPHIHMLMTPIRETKKGPSLSARSLFHGKKILSNLQTEIHEKCGQAYGLDRGEIGSLAKHRPLPEYHKDLARVPGFTVDVPPKMRKDQEREEWSKKETSRLKRLVGKTVASENRKMSVMTRQLTESKREASEYKSSYESQYRASMELKKENEELREFKENMIPAYSRLVETLAFATPEHLEEKRENARKFLKKEGQTKAKLLKSQEVEKQYRPTQRDRDLGLGL